MSERSARQPAPAQSSLKPVTLKFLADHLDLSPATISLVINRSPAARSIPKSTHERVLAAAREFRYRPNTLARSLRQQRSFTIGVMVPEISEGYTALVMAGIEDHLLNEGYLYFVASHRHRPDLIAESPGLMMGRSVEGLIAVDTLVSEEQPVPVVAVSGHGGAEGVTNIALDHALAANLALEHLHSLGHRRIAFIKGQAFSSDTEERWSAIVTAARERGLTIDPRLTKQLVGNSPSPELGESVTRQILDEGAPFTALFAFNDISAIGAIRALRSAGLRVPQDVSVVGFDDVQSAAFQNPSLTTVRQPLRHMGAVAAQTLLKRIAAPSPAPYPRFLTIEPKLVVRESTAPVAGSNR